MYVSESSKLHKVESELDSTVEELNFYKTEYETIKSEVIQHENLESPILITALHLPSVRDTSGNHKVVEKNKQNDRVIIHNTEHVYSKISVGSEVIINDKLEGKVIESEEGKFEIEVTDTKKIYKGLSGTPIKYKHSGLKIGYVSAMTADLTVIAYTYK